MLEENAIGQVRRKKNQHRNPVHFLQSKQKSLNLQKSKEEKKSIESFYLTLQNVLAFNVDSFKMTR